MFRSMLPAVCLAALALAGTPVSKLEKRYQEWLNGPPSYLVTKTERAAFLNLATDAERDAFIERFWKIRGDDFREEFYRRVAYANAHFGAEAGSDGWRTDMGKTWILFGRPRSSMDYKINQNLYPIELWFYSNPGLSELPPFFYVLFYEKDDISGYRLYHPYVDGPARLVRGGPSREQAYRALYQVSPELAQASLSLIPGEPIDTDTYSGSMESGKILNAVQAYREMPSYIASITARAQRLEQVTSHVQYNVAQASLLTLVAWQKGEPWLHWQLEVDDPMTPKASAGRVQYQLKAQLFSHGQLVFERSDAPSFAVPEGQQEALKKRPFVYEDRMPVVPGRYHLVVSALNAAADRSYETSKDIDVPAPADRAGVSDLLVVARHDPDPRPRPFNFGGVKFLPSATGLAQALRGLSVLYEVHLNGPRPPELEAEYVIGSIGGRFRKTFTDKLDTRQADAWGALVTAKTLAIEDLAPGPYQLALRLKDLASGKISGASVRFQVSGGEETAAPIVVSRGTGDTPQMTAANQYERALCWLAQDRPQEALGPLETAWNLSRNPAIRGLLTHLYRQTGQMKTKREEGK